MVTSHFSVPGRSVRIGFRLVVFSALVMLILTLAPRFSAAAPVDLTANDILRTVREAQAGRNDALDGQLRLADGKVLPFRLVAAGPTVRYEFPGPPPTVLQVRYAEDYSQLTESTGGGETERMTPANFDKKILGTDLTYEDLSLRFIYWRRAKLLESDDKTTFPTYKLRLDAPSRASQYAYVLLWVMKDSFALANAEAYDGDGKLVKRLDVVSGQPLNGKWYLKQLRIENLDPENGRTRSRTYLEIKGIAHSGAGVR